MYSNKSVKTSRLQWLLTYMSSGNVLRNRLPIVVTSVLYICN